jgi:hypothetical protein
VKYEKKLASLCQRCKRWREGDYARAIRVLCSIMHELDDENDGCPERDEQPDRREGGRAEPRRGDEGACRVELRMHAEEGEEGRHPVQDQPAAVCTRTGGRSERNGRAPALARTGTGAVMRRAEGAGDGNRQKRRRPCLSWSEAETALPAHELWDGEEREKRMTSPQASG